MSKQTKDPWHREEADNAFIKRNMVKISPYPKDFIPDGAEPIIGYDPALEYGDCTVKGFYKDGEYHIQEVIPRKTD